MLSLREQLAAKLAVNAEEEDKLTYVDKISKRVLILCLTGWLTCQATCDSLLSSSSAKIEGLQSQGCVRLV